jgi:uncharacterized protein (DUF58 family)
MIRSLYLKKRFFASLGVLAVVFILANIFPALIIPAEILFVFFSLILLADAALLYQLPKPIITRRFIPDKLSNGDENVIRIYTESRYSFPVKLAVIDEIPHQFQRRDIEFLTDLPPRKNKVIEYQLVPKKRGEYDFGRVNVFIEGRFGLILRRQYFDLDVSVPVYPSFLQMQKFELMAFSDRLTELGIKKIRKIGHNLEFDQIKDYIPGDDYRTINWKATARRGGLMVNVFQDEKSQQVYSLIDKGRTMRMPFENMTLLDYAINASLVVSNVAIKKDDQAGLITFQQKVSNIIPASKRGKQMMLIMEALYHEKTAFRESDYSSLSMAVSRNIKRRSLLLLFTNFETLSGMMRQLPYLKQMARNHLLVTIFFENTEMTALLNASVNKTKQIYKKAIAEKLAYEKRLIVKELQYHGIHVILTPPEDLTINTINKYLELKSRGLI